MNAARRFIPFNKPFLTGKETEYIRMAVESGKISGNGDFTRRCQENLEARLHSGKILLTSSCTDALEMAAILLDIRPGDQVIAPSYTFVSSVNAFVLRGAEIVFADSRPDHPNIDETQIEKLITPKTRAIICVHYAGIACEMDAILGIANKHGLAVVEDAAHAIASFYRGDRALGTLGTIGVFSFHETKNIIAGEGGAISINKPELVRRAEIIWEKGTNRAAFFRGEADRYTWTDIGSSFLPSEITAAFLYAQLENAEQIQARRLQSWKKYPELLQPLAEKGFFSIPVIPGYATNNAHMFYLVCRSGEERAGLIAHLAAKQIHAVFHYQPLHRSPFYLKGNNPVSLPNAERFADCLLRLPLYYELELADVEYICEAVKEYYTQK